MAEQDETESTANSGKNTGLANLRPWQPGQSGNPSGRPKKKPFTELCEEISADPKAMAGLRAAMVDAMSKSDMVMVQVVKLMAERVDGPVTQQISGPGGGPIPLEMFRIIDDADDE